jgi:succinate dehydrogenase / fumarate reductase cytochrome b subunit
MIWFIRTVTSSIGKKLLMAITGLIFCSFLAFHLIGNLMIYGGKDAFNGYSEHLHSLGLLVNAVEVGLLVCALIHIFFAALLYFENLRARPVGYAMKKGAGGQTISSRIMPYTGLYLLVFVIIHLFTFHFVEKTDQGIYQIVAGVFSRPAYVLFYIFSMAVAFFHIKHGFWSAFQTIGANHPKYMPFIRGMSLIFSLVVGVVFGSVPLFMFLST